MGCQNSDGQALNLLSWNLFSSVVARPSVRPFDHLHTYGIWWPSRPDNRPHFVKRRRRRRRRHRHSALVTFFHHPSKLHCLFSLFSKQLRSTILFYFCVNVQACTLKRGKLKWFVDLQTAHAHVANFVVTYPVNGQHKEAFLYTYRCMTRQVKRFARFLRFRSTRKALWASSFLHIVPTNSLLGKIRQ